MSLENDLKECFRLMDEMWGKQSSSIDAPNNDIVFKTDTLDECLCRIEAEGVDKNHTLHRWYNFKTSTECEKIFCEYGAKKEKNERHHTIDVYIDGVPFDVKLTLFPRSLYKERPSYAQETPDGKKALIEWLYLNQTQDNRKHMKNRIFVVCDAGNNYKKSLGMKCDFPRLREGIKNYMQSHNSTTFEQYSIPSDGVEHKVYSDIILIKL